jgi:hypothetical protein
MHGFSGHLHTTSPRILPKMVNRFTTAAGYAVASAEAGISNLSRICDFARQHAVAAD